METQHFLKILCLSGAILIQNDGQPDSLLYTYSDFQGSLIALTDVSGNVVEKYAYDPWGARRNPTDWTQKDLRTKWITNRGYTGHEHLDAFGIINMNGRVYDPLTAMFFSPDPYVQAPGNWLNYNRYGYCYGNPFRYTDPSGQFIQILIGAAIGGLINWGIHGFQFNLNGLAAFGIGAAGGALVALTCGAALGTVTAGLAAGGGMSAAGGLGVTMAAAGMGYTAGTLVTSVGNNLYFHDPMPTQNQYLQGLAFNLITAGVLYEIAPPQVIRDTRPIPDPIKTPTVGIKPSDVNVASEANVTSSLESLPETNESFTINTSSREISNESVEGQSINIQRPDINGYNVDKTDIYHDFPRLMDKEIVQNGSIAQRIDDKALFFTAPGTLTNTAGINIQGVYTIGINNNGIVFHRCFYKLADFISDFH